MIVPMKHVTILSTISRRRSVIIRLRNMGLLHITREHEAAEVSSKIHTRFTVCKQALQIMRQYRTITPEKLRRRKSKTRMRDSGAFPGEHIAQQAVELERRIEALRAEWYRIEHHVADLRVWGAFKWETIERLQERGLYCHFYTIPKKQFKREAPPQAIRIAQQHSKVYFVVIAQTEENTLPYEEAVLPAHNLERLYARREEISNEKKQLQAQQLRLSRLLPTVWIAYQRLYQLNQIISVRSAFQWRGETIFIRGFMPARNIEELKRHATEMKWGLFIRDPYPDEEPPTVLANPKSIAMVNPVYRILSTLPGYREPDISALFLIFFVLFFAIIIGDAGYAALLIGCALGYRICARSERQKQGARLLCMVGVATLAWGALSGNWFGVEQIATLPPFSWVLVRQLHAFDARSIPFVQWICFLIAAVHISIAHIWRTIYQWKHGYWLQACTNIGWICLVLGIYSLVIRLILGAFGFWYMEQVTPLLFVGFAIIVVCGQQRRGAGFFAGIVKGVGSLFSTLLDSISAFADVISYLRLFAVGLASVEIARSFNQIAASIEGGVGATIGSVATLFIGHSLNLAMGALSIIVHGVRLNMLEFSSHIGVEWSGIVYRPFGHTEAR